MAVRVVRHDAFDLDDPATSTWPSRWVDALHIVTRGGVHPSPPPLPGRRPPRSRPARRERDHPPDTGFLNPVNISARPVPGGAEVVVETRDQWTTSIRGSYAMSGDRTSVSFGPSEDNLLGLGKSFLLEVSSDPERTSTTFGYQDITFLRSRWQLELGHRSSSDGSADLFRLEYPFFSLRTPRAGGAVTGSAGLRGRVAADLGTALDGERQLTLGADSGLRGYDPDTFDGTSRFVANAEWRGRITGELLHVAAFGLTALPTAG